jgi:hypothetical protein
LSTLDTVETDTPADAAMLVRLPARPERDAPAPALAPPAEPPAPPAEPPLPAPVIRALPLTFFEKFCPDYRH